MKRLRAIFLMQAEMGALAHSIALDVGLDINSITINTTGGIEAAIVKPYDLLLSFGSGVIVPQNILITPGLTALNIHAATPEFPGRDPHHFAIYRKAKTYGATLHYMTEKVDDGQILDIETFKVPDEIKPEELLAKANLAGIELMKRLFIGYANSGMPTQLQCGLSWSVNKSRRSDFLELCRIDCEMTEYEFLQRLKSTNMTGYNNLFIDIHGYRFRFEGPVK